MQRLAPHHPARTPTAAPSAVTALPRASQGGPAPTKAATAGAPAHPPPSAPSAGAAAAARQHRSLLWQSQHVIDGPGGWPTELLGVQATTAQPAVQLLVVPGNPGHAQWYSVFAQQLHAAFGGAADVCAVSHVGHDIDGLTGGQLFGLEEQIQHKAAVLQEVVLTPGRPPLVILGHSIGAWITLQALQRLQAQGGAHLSGLLKVMLLMPFLATTGQSWEQRILAAAAQRHAGALTAAAAHVSSNAWLQDRAAQLLLPGAEPHATATLRLGFSPSAFSNNWHLAADEFRRLDAPVDWGLIRRLGSKAAVVFNPADVWFSQHTQLEAELPGIEAHSQLGLGHAFCLSTAECGAVAQLVRASVAAALAEAAGSERAVPGAAGRECSGVPGRVDGRRAAAFGV